MTTRILVTDEAEQIVATLTYINYAHNRRLSPEITPEQWRKVYGGAADQMERQFRADFPSIVDAR